VGARDLKTGTNMLQCVAACFAVCPVAACVAAAAWQAVKTSQERKCFSKVSSSLNLRYKMVIVLTLPHCNTLQHTATHCTATHCNAL